MLIQTTGLGIAAEGSSDCADPVRVTVFANQAMGEEYHIRSMVYRWKLKLWLKVYAERIRREQRRVLGCPHAHAVLLVEALAVAIRLLADALRLLGVGL